MLYPVQTSRERCASNNISHDNENPLAWCCFLYSDFWEGPIQISVPLSNFPANLYQIIEPLRKHIFLDVKVNTFRASEKAHFSGREGNTL